MYELAYQSWIGIGTFTSADSQALPRMHTSAKTVYVDLQTTMIADMCIQLHIRVWYILWQDIFVSAASSMHLWKPASGHSRSHFHPKVIIHTTWRHCVYCAHYSATGRTWDTRDHTYSACLLMKDAVVQSLKGVVRRIWSSHDEHEHLPDTASVINQSKRLWRSCSFERKKGVLEFVQLNACMAWYETSNCQKHCRVM